MHKQPPSLLLVDDDETFCSIMGRALSKRGFGIRIAHDVASAMLLSNEEMPDYALIDLKMRQDSGLMLVRHLHAQAPDTRIVILTGYASISTAIQAIQQGATHYLPKPANADDIVAAFQKTNGDASTPVASTPLSLNRLEWEHIQRVLAMHNGNVTAAAQALRMHRRSLQRKLAKRPPEQADKSSQIY